MHRLALIGSLIVLAGCQSLPEPKIRVRSLNASWTEKVSGRVVKDLQYSITIPQPPSFSEPARKAGYGSFSFMLQDGDERDVATIHEVIDRYLSRKYGPDRYRWSMDDSKDYKFYVHYWYVEDAWRDQGKRGMARVLYPVQVPAYESPNSFSGILVIMFCPEACGENLEFTRTLLGSIPRLRLSRITEEEYRSLMEYFK